MDGKRYEFTWVDQNMVLVVDHKEDDEFYIHGDVEMIRRHAELPADVANVFAEGYFAGIEWCDRQLKYCIHNFIQRE